MTLPKRQRVIRLLTLLHLIDIVSTQTDKTSPCPYNATVAVPPVQPLHEWNYLGCYQDNDENRVLNSTMYWGPGNNTVPGCANFCAGYAFFGVEYGAQCFCGVSLGVAANTEPAGNAHCNYTCCADRTVSCGGVYYIHVYEAVESAPTPPSSAGSGGGSDAANRGDGNSVASNNIALGVGLGFGIPMFIIAAVTLGFKCANRRRKRKTNEVTPTAYRGATPESSVYSTDELDSVTAMQPRKLDRYA